jgi:transcriptional repressor of cell division inhibition gene dicB
MTTKEAIEWAGSLKELSFFLRVWPQVIYNWGERPPMGRQYELEIKSKGKLKADKK